MIVQLPENMRNMKITKTETEYNMRSIRFLLLTITTMFIVIAGLMMILGTSVYTHYHSVSYFFESATSGKLVTPSVLCVFIGLAMLVISFFGFFGSLKQSTCMVNFYALILTLVMILKMVVVIMAFKMDTATLMNYIYLPVQDYVNDSEIEYEMDALQSTVGCCGANSYMDYMGMEFSNQSTVVISREYDGDLMTMVIPSSCCVTEGEVYCSRMWSNGCKAALVELLIQNASILGVLGVSVMFINLLGIIFALLLARCIRKVKSERSLILWKIKEQMIMAREAEEAMKGDNQTVYIEHAASSTA